MKSVLIEVVCLKIVRVVGLEVKNVMNAAFYDMTPYSVVGFYCRFKRFCCLSWGL
jgi:hypothetical protein